MCIATLSVHTAMIAEYSGTTNRVGQGTGIAMLFVFVTFFAGCIDVSKSHELAYSPGTGH